MVELIYENTNLKGTQVFSLKCVQRLEKVICMFKPHEVIARSYHSFL